MEKIHAVATNLNEYNDLEPTRLKADQISNDQLYQLMMKNVGNGPEAYIAPVFIKEVLHVMSIVAIQVYFTDKDLRPMRVGLRSTIKKDFWFPVRPVPLTSKKARGEARTGYLLPYDDAFDDELLRATEELSQYV